MRHKCNSRSRIFYCCYKEIKGFSLVILPPLTLGLTRRNMIALALLLGCDYLPAGVPGVGKETAVKLFTSLPGVDLLDR